MSDIIKEKFEIPSFLLEDLQKQYGSAAEKIVAGYTCERPVTLRINTLKSNSDEVQTEFHRLGISFDGVDWYKDALILKDVREDTVRQTELYREGKIYLQSLSSMLPPLYLTPQAEENLLDMTAAPGGKTTQLFALSGGKALITACEKDKIRFDRLSYNVRVQGAGRVNLLNEDALKLNDFLRFDKILLDAPCSGSGTLSPFTPMKISEKLIQNCAALQEKLLLKGIKLLKKGGTLLYSTCSVLGRENDEVIKRVIGHEGVRLEAISPLSDKIPVLASLAGTLCVAPNEYFEGFFLAKLVKTA